MNNPEESHPEPPPKWPPTPYKGLNYYGQEDAPLFVGRDAEIRECANRLGQFSTRILVLQGPTGCGKSSFLQAGLIPYLEDETIGFQFTRARGGGEWRRAVFVRATDRPLLKLAEAVYELIRGEASLASLAAGGARRPGEAAGAGPSPVELLGADPVLMVRTLMGVARRLPKTLVLIIDQAEEVLTLDATADGDHARTQFFKFLQLFSRVRCDLKLIITLRTDFYGRFENHLQKEAGWVDAEEPLGQDLVASVAGKEPAPADRRGIRSYFLEDLPREQLIKVIKLPTSREPLGRYGVPYRHYRFSYAAGLPEKIILDIEHAIHAGRLAGGTLPVLQIVCDRLYNTTKAQTKPGEFWEITDAHYQRLRSVEDQLSAYLIQVLDGLCRRYYRGHLEVSKVDDLEVHAEVSRWLKALSRLIQVHPDNTVTKQFCRDHELEQRADELGCKVNFKWLIEELERGSIRVLSSASILPPGERRRVICYSLGHDSIALALQRWLSSAGEDPVEEAPLEGGRDVLLESILVEARRLGQIKNKDRRLWAQAVSSVARLYAARFQVTAERIKELADKIHQNSSFRPSDDELQVLATQPESYYPQALQRGRGGAVLRLPVFDNASSSIEEEGGEAGILAKSMKAKAMSAKA